MTVELSKKYTTRDGREVRLLMVDGGGDFPVIGAIHIDGEWSPETWKLNGRNLHEREHKDDLVEVKPQRTVWLNIYPEDVAYLNESRERADEKANMTRIACVEVTFREGDGLNG